MHANSAPNGAQKNRVVRAGKDLDVLPDEARTGDAGADAILQEMLSSPRIEPAGNLVKVCFFLLFLFSFFFFFFFFLCGVFFTSIYSSSYYYFNIYLC